MHALGIRCIVHGWNIVTNKWTPLSLYFDCLFLCFQATMNLKTHTCKWIPRAALQLSHLPLKGGKGALRSSRPYLEYLIYHPYLLFKYPEKYRLRVQSGSRIVVGGLLSKIHQFAYLSLIISLTSSHPDPRYNMLDVKTIRIIIFHPM